MTALMQHYATLDGGVPYEAVQRHYDEVYAEARAAGKTPPSARQAFLIAYAKAEAEASERQGSNEDGE
jgi:hypothetical protein